MLSMSPTPKARVSSAQESAYAWIREFITRVPQSDGVFLTEGQVVEKVGLSRTPVREALLRLETEGLLQILPKKGAYIPAISEREAADVMQARALIETWCSEHIIDDRHALADDLEKIVTAQVELLDQPIQFITKGREFHTRLVAGAGNDILRILYESLRDRQDRMSLNAVTSSRDRTRRVIDEHRLIVDALRDESVSIDSAQAIKAHLTSTWDSSMRSPLVLDS